jgi:hypothetical protein
VVEPKAKPIKTRHDGFRYALYAILWTFIRRYNPTLNAKEGEAFFVVDQAVDPGMIKVIEHDILPRLERDIPNQPTPGQ